MGKFKEKPAPHLHTAPESEDQLWVLNRTDPMRSARLFRQVLFRDEGDGQSLLHHLNGNFYEWRGHQYCVVGEDAIRSQIWTFLEVCQSETKNGNLELFRPTRNSVLDTLDALKAITHLDQKYTPPCWLDNPDNDASNFVPVANGLYDIRKKKLWPPTPSFFSTTGSPVVYKPDAPTPEVWYEFLDSLWPSDDESKATLQELMGLMLTGDTSHQKIFLLVGPKRAGKGTIAWVAKELLGHGNVAGPTLSSLVEHFGLQALIGKTVAIIGDAKLSGRADQGIITERLLSISGEDSVTIDRKFREPWTGKFTTRFFIHSNELPRLNDNSGALLGRLVVLTLENSFLGKEDRSLKKKLQTELPGILCWAIDGLHRLRKRGHFIQPKSAIEAIEKLHDLTSPLTAFIDDRCQTGVGHNISCQRLYDAWRAWCSMPERCKHSVAIYMQHCHPYVQTRNGSMA